MRAWPLGIGVLLSVVGWCAVACSSFGAGPSDDPKEGGTVPPESVTDAGADVPDAEVERGSGCGVVPFVHRFAKPGDPIFDGWDDTVTYGPQEQLSLVQVADAGVSGDGVLRAAVTPANPSESRGKVYVHRLEPANLPCVGVEMTFRVLQPPANVGGIITSALRFGPESFYGFALGANGDVVVAQQEGSDYQPLGRAPIETGRWHVVRLVYRSGPVLEASLDGARIALELNPLMPFADPKVFHAGVTYAPAASAVDFEIDEVRVF